MLVEMTIAEVLANVIPGDTRGNGVMEWSELVDWKADSANFSELALTILEDGFSPAAPILMRHFEDGVRLIDGHHRMSIAILLGLESVPVYVAGLGTGGMNDATAPFGPRPTTKAR